MNAFTAPRRSFEARSFLGTLGFGRIRAGLQGMMFGYEIYKIYTALDAMSDAQLKAKGIDRANLPAVAIKTITQAGQA